MAPPTHPAGWGRSAAQPTDLFDKAVNGANAVCLASLRPLVPHAARHANLSKFAELFHNSVQRASLRRHGGKETAFGAPLLQISGRSCEHVQVGVCAGERAGGEVAQGETGEAST